MAFGDMEVAVNLFSEGDKFFDLLKAAIRDWQKGWAHERERAAYALDLYQRGLDTMKQHIEKVKAKVESGFFTAEDQRILSRLEERVAYWEKKLREVQGQDV